MLAHPPRFTWQAQTLHLRNPFRLSYKDEIVGLDIPEMGARGYWEGSHPNIRTVI